MLKLEVANPLLSFGIGPSLDHSHVRDSGVGVAGEPQARARSWGAMRLRAELSRLHMFIVSTSSQDHIQYMYCYIVRIGRARLIEHHCIQLTQIPGE